MARLRRGLALVLVAGAAGFVLSGCGVGAAVTDARAACVHVHEALRLQVQSDGPNLTAGRRETLRADAMAALLRAMPEAAQATTADGSWNALQTAINESERVPLAQTTAPLRLLCRVADSSTPYIGS